MRPPDPAAILCSMRLTCLIVDDNERFLAAASNLLTREGVHVVGVAATGAEARELVAELQPDVTLVDIDLNGESGFDVAKQLSGLASVEQHVILISSHSGRDFADLIDSSSAVGFVPKAELSASAIEQLVRPAREL
jgi:DNA-binding NarL/FixJ family response regulator